MTAYAGIWIDHREAYLVHLPESGDSEIVKHITSDAESQPRRASDHPSENFESQKVPADNKRERKFSAELSKYYDRVIALLHDTETLLIFGPGEAKEELMQHIRSANQMPTNISMETADRMTTNQIAAKVRDFFQSR